MAVPFGLMLWLPISWLTKGGIRDANPFPISIVDKGGSGRAGRDTRGMFSVRVFSPSTHLHPRRQEGKGRKGAVMSANEDGSTGCILSSYHLWLLAERRAEQESRSAEACLSSP